MGTGRLTHRLVRFTVVVSLGLALLAILLALLARTAIVRADGPGDLDLSFNNTGIVTTSIVGPSPKLYLPLLIKDY